MDRSLVIDNIKDVIETMRYYVQRDGGDLRFISFENNEVTIEILGACVGCAMIDVTYKNGIEAILKNEISDVKSVKIIEGNNWGKDPFFKKDL